MISRQRDVVRDVAVHRDCLAGLVNSLLDGEVLIPLLDVRGEPVAGVELDDISVAVKESETCTINQATLVKESETGIESFLRLSLNWNNRWMPIEKAITLCLSVNSIPIGEYSIEASSFLVLSCRWL